MAVADEKRSEPTDVSTALPTCATMLTF
uniref:Uncharacterized protein n=1 Tax=Tetranychus urticae TaxID=32264 RepID=T1KWY0_TETUR